MAPKGETVYKPVTLFGVQEQACFQGLSRELLGPIFNRSYMDLQILFANLGKVFRAYYCKSTKPPDAKRKAKQEPNKIQQDQTRSTKESTSKSQQAPHAETDHQMRSPKIVDTKIWNDSKQCFNK